MDNVPDILIKDFVQNPTKETLVNLIEGIKFKPGDSIDTPAKILVCHLQFLSRALNGGNTELTRYVQDTKQKALDVRMSEDQLKFVIIHLICKKAKNGVCIASQFHRLDKYNAALNDLRQQFDILKNK